MSILPEQGRVAFAALHPAVTFAFFAGAIVLCMCFSNPAFQALSIVCAAALYLTLRGRRALPFIGGLGVALVVIALVNPLFATQGDTVLFTWWGGRPYTLEALALGASTGAMLVAMMLWFASYHLVMTADKFTYLFGGVIPALSMVLTMVLRLVPGYRRRADALLTARACIGKWPAEGAGLVQRARAAAAALAALSATALEDAIITADSMRARGYGLAGRTRYALFRWDGRDVATAAVMAALLVGAVAALVAGGTAVTFFPTISLPPLTPAGVLGGVCYGAFLALPTAYNLGERALWLCSLSRI